MRKKILILSCLLAILLAACACPVTPLFAPTPTARPSALPPETSTVPPPPIDLSAAPFDHPWDDRQPFEVNLSEAGRAALDGLPGASVYHLALSFDDPPNQAAGVEEILYTNTENVPLEKVELALFPNLLGGSLHFQRLLLDGAALEPDIRNWLLRIPFEPPLQPGRSVILHLEFEVQVPSRGGDYYYGIFGYNNGILSLAHACPTVLVYNQEGWNDQVPDLDGDPLFSDASFYLVLVDAPSSLTIVASGAELERLETAGRQEVLIADGPARDFYLAASRDLVRASRQTEGGVTVNSYAPPGEEAGGRAALDYGVAAIETFSHRYGDYPYSEFDIMPIVTSAGGVEYPGMTSISNDAYSWDDFLEIVVVHEAAHMWFYNLVGNDTLDQPWLDESLAQFATWQYFLDRRGAKAAEQFKQTDLLDNWGVVQQKNIPIGLPVADYTSAEYVAIVYGRGALFFMALRDQMGVEAFDQFMRAYVRQYSWGIASTEGFKALAESHCNCDLSPLFAEWVYP